MLVKLKNTLLVMAFIPLLAMSALELNTVPDSPTSDNNIFSTKGNKDEDNLSIEQKEREEKAKKIELYFKARSMPLADNSMQFVLVAEKYGLPYNLLPAISIRESSGGKRYMNNNPFGWGSAKIKFSNFNEAIEVVGKNLGGGNPNTARYYAVNDVKKKLYYYNGTIIKGYGDQVIDIMNKIDKVDIEKDMQAKELAKK